MLDAGQMLTADPLPGGQESASVSLTKNSVSNKLLLRVGLSRETKKAGLIDSPGSHRHTHNAFGRVIKISCQSHLNLRTMKFRFCFLQAQSRDTRSLNLTYFKVVIICVCGGGISLWMLNNLLLNSITVTVIFMWRHTFQFHDLEYIAFLPFHLTDI